MASVDDLQSRGWKRQVLAVGTANAVLPAGTRIHCISVAGGSAVSVLQLYNALTVTGTDIITVNSVVSSQGVVNLGFNGTVMTTGVTAVLAGTAAVATIFYSEN